MKDIDRQIINTIGRHADELLNENWPSISEMLKEVPDGKINVGIAVALDWSEASPKIKTVISYSRKWKDEREDELDDPNQKRLNLGGVTKVEFSINGGTTDPAASTDSPSDSEPETEPPTPANGDAEPVKPKRVRKAKVD